MLPTTPSFDDAPTVDLTGDSDDDEAVVMATAAPAAARAAGAGPLPPGAGACRRKTPAGEDVVCILDSPPRRTHVDRGQGAGPAAGQGAGPGGITCVICMDVIGAKNMASTVCGHVFCHECITEALKASKKCPTCRKTLRPTQVHRLYV